ncbi:MAG: rhamnulokinase [Herbinix sp.]|jgi:hypothetical protein|nr:rhamnulokinase [Herbinix sp.]
MGNNYMAIDIEENKGKLTLGYLTDGKLQLEEVHSFELSKKDTDGVLRNDKIIDEIKAGLIKCKEIKKLPILVGVNEWNQEIIYKLCHMGSLFPEEIKPGSIIGSLALDVTEEVGYDCIVIVPATKHIASMIEKLLIGETLENKILTISSILYSLFFSHEIPDLQTAEECLR